MSDNKDKEEEFDWPALFEDESLSISDIVDLTGESWNYVQRHRAEYRKKNNLPPIPKGRRLLKRDFDKREKLSLPDNLQQLQKAHVALGLIIQELIQDYKENNS